MHKQLFWVLMTYIERPLFWILSLGAMGVWLYFLPLGGAHYSPCHPKLTLRHGAVFDAEDLDQVLSENRAAAITDISFDAFWNDAFQTAIQSVGPGERPPGIEGAQRAAADRIAALADLPNLQRVTFTRRNVNITGDGQPVQPDLPLQTLGQLSQAQDLSLSFLGVQDVPENVLQPLSNLRELRALQLEHFEALPSLQPLADLPRLETLILVYCDGLTPQRFAEMGRLKHLQTLVLPDIAQLDQRDNLLAELSPVPWLTTVYVAGRPEDASSLEAVRTALPDARVLRGWYNPRRVGAFVAGAWLFLFLGFGTVHLSAQFGLPQSRLTPAFALPHASVASAAILAVVAIHSLLLWSQGAELWPAAAAAGTFFLVALTLFSRTGQLPRKSNRTTSGRYPYPWLQAILGAVFGIGVIVGTSLLFNNFAAIAPYVELYLLGESNVLPWVLTLLTFLLAATLVRNLSAAHETHAEAGLPVVLAINDFQSYQRQLVANERYQQSEFFLHKFDRVLEDAITNHHASTRWHRVQRWRAGITTRLQLTIVLIVPVFFLSSWAFSGFAAGFTLQKALGMTGLIYFLCAAMVAMQWWQGYSHLLTALQWPLSRRTLVGDVFAAVALDMLLPAPLIMLGIAGYLSVIGVISTAWFISGLAILLGSLGVVALCYAGSLWLITIRHVWALVAFAGGSYALASILLIPGLMFASADAGPASPTPLRIALVGTMACLVAAGLVALAHRRWMRLEIGKYA